MTDKSGGDILQGNAAQQGNLSAQDLNALGVGGVGAVGALGGTGLGTGTASQLVDQDQSQGNLGLTGDGGDDNIQANTTINIS